MLRKYSKELYYAPYTAIIQSSGMGKTRMIESLTHEDDVCVVYCNVNKLSKNSSYPQRTKNFANFLLQSCSRQMYEENVYRYFYEFINFIDERDESPKFSFENCPDTTNGEICKCERCQVWNKLNAYGDQSITKSADLKRKKTGKNGNKMIVFAFDEARSLTENFPIDGKKISIYSFKIFF